MHKMKLKLQWEMKQKLQDEHEKIKLQKSFGNQIRKMKYEQSALEQDVLEKLKQMIQDFRFKKGGDLQKLQLELKTSKK